MGWWEIDGDDVIGDQPADIVGLKLLDLAGELQRRGLPKPRLGDLLRALERVLRGRENELLDRGEDRPVGRLRMRGVTTRADDSAPATDAAAGLIEATVEEILVGFGNVYGDIIGRRPRLSEVLASFTFVLRSSPEDYLRDLREDEVGEIVEKR